MQRELVVDKWLSSHHRGRATNISQSRPNSGLGLSHFQNESLEILLSCSLPHQVVDNWGNVVAGPSFNFRSISIFPPTIHRLKPSLVGVNPVFFHAPIPSVPRTTLTMLEGLVQTLSGPVNSWGFLSRARI